MNVPALASNCFYLALIGALFLLSRALFPVRGLLLAGFKRCPFLRSEKLGLSIATTGIRASARTVESLSLSDDDLSFSCVCREFVVDLWSPTENRGSTPPVFSGSSGLIRRRCNGLRCSLHNPVGSLKPPPLQV